jgi:MFS family permease
MSGPDAVSPEGDETASFPSAFVAWAAVVILVLLSILAYLDRQILSLMIGMIKTEFKVSDSSMALLQGAAFSIVYACAAFPFGFAVDRYPRRLILFIGVFAWALAATFCGLAFSFSTLLAARLGVGLGEAALNPVIASMLSDLFPKKRLATAFAVVSLGSTIGTQGALIIGGAVLYWAGDGMTLPILGHMAPWKIAFIVTGAPGLLLAFSIFLIPEPKRRLSAAAAAGPKTRWVDVFPFMLAHRNFLLCYIGGFAALAVSTTSLMTWGPTVLQRIYGMTPGATGVVLGTFALSCGVIGTLIAGVTVDRLYAMGRLGAHATFYAVSGLAMALAGVATIFAKSPWIYILVLVPAKLMSNFAGVGTAGLQIITPSHLRGRIAALFAFFTVLCGATIGPTSVAFFTDFVFKDDMKVHWSVAAAMTSFGLLAAVLLVAANRIISRTSAVASPPVVAEATPAETP